MRPLHLIVASTSVCVVVGAALWMASPQPDHREPVAVSAGAQPAAPGAGVQPTIESSVTPLSPATVRAPEAVAIKPTVIRSVEQRELKRAAMASRRMNSNAAGEVPSPVMFNGQGEPTQIQRQPTELVMVGGGSFTGDLRNLPQAPVRKRERPEREEPTSNPVSLPLGRGGNQSAVTGVPPVVGPSAPAPATSVNFEGLDFNTWGAGHPPDVNGDVGPNHFIESVNTSIGIYSKAGGAPLAAFTFDTFMSQGAFGNLCDTDNYGDPVVLYDTFEDRWVITDFAFVLDVGGNVLPPGMLQCFAVSKTADPVAGGWNFYSINTTGGLGDYGKFGIWPDGLYMSVNMFNYASGGGFQNARVYALNKAQMYAGSPSVQVVSFDLPSSEFSLLPANARLQTGTPPAGSPNYFTSVWNYLNIVSVWKFHVDWARVALSTLTGPTNVGTTTSWSQFTGASQRVPSPAFALDTLYPRLMMQNQYSNIGGVESLWNSHTVGASGASSAQASVRYYQVKVTGGTPEATATQAFTYSPADTLNRFMPSAAVNKNGDMAIGYNTVNATTNPAIVYAGRLAGDAVNTISLTEQTLVAGAGTQSGSNRWGDYATMTLDPDGCKFWFVSEYYQVTGLNDNTRIGAFTFPGCAANTTGTLTGTVKDISALPLVGATVALGARTTTTNASGVYTFAGLPSGTYPSVKASLSGYASSTFTNVAVAGTQNFTLTAAPTTSCFVDTTQADFQADNATDCDLNTTPGAVQLFNVPTIDQQNTAGTTTGTFFGAVAWTGQTFVPAVTGTLVMADVQLFCSGCGATPPNLTLSVRSTSGGLPTGADLASTTIPGSAFASGFITNYLATFGSPATLTSGTQYALILRPVSVPAGSGYAWVRSSPGTYANGQRVLSADSGANWSSDSTRDYNFKTYMQAGYSATGTFVSSIKDANPAVVGGAVWGTIAWNATVPAGTTLKFQVAASTSANGPFTFVGPDNTAATYFTSGASLALFNGKRYLRYKAFLTSTGASTPTLQDVTVCFNNGPAAGPPVGQVDTPSQSATGVQGAIGVTGWALDDTGITSVGIYRNCLGFEPGNCQTVLGNSVVYIGDAAFLPGARPDVAAAFPTYPNNTRAGWGYLMLTPMLPNVTNSLAYGGQGTLTLYAIATDTNGNKKLLGRSSDPASPSYATPTTITMSNSTIAKPFGAIDTPGQGQTISGVFNNFGWAITPDSDTIGGNAPDSRIPLTDILIPTNGSTMTVFIDSLPVALVAYNQCRGNVGNPVPGGLYCNDDVANIFGNPTPQPVLTTRTSNPTKFRNLDAGRAAIGAYTFNTASLSDGLHTIAWSVSDSQARNEGIGSRFFIVQNGSRPELLAGDAVPEAPAQEAQALDTAKLREHTPVTSGVWGRTGFDLGTPWATMHAQDDGTFAVRLPEMGRLELWLGDAVEAGYLVANDTLQPLPVGASLSGPRFGWMPPAGYIGPYHLAFVRHGERIDVTVTVIEKPRVAEDEAQIRMQLEAATQGNAAVGHLNERTVQLDGWAFDPQAAMGSGIAAVHVWATPEHGDGATPFFVGAAALDQARPDVARAFKDAPSHAGFSLTASLKPGTYTLTAYAWNERTARWEDARSVTVTVR